MHCSREQRWFISPIHCPLWLNTNLHLGFSSFPNLPHPILGFELRAYTLSHSTSPFLWWGFSRWGVSRTICLGWLQTRILLNFASWVARITGLSHQCLVPSLSLRLCASDRSPLPLLPLVGEACAQDIGPRPVKCTVPHWEGRRDSARWPCLPNLMPKGCMVWLLSFHGHMET
jgi:hypothetical protein